MAEATNPAASNRIRAVWAAGRCAVLGWLQIPSALTAETLALCGYDGLVIDLQHSPTDFVTAVAMMTAIEGRGAEPFVRVSANDAAEIGRMLDAGAYGVIAPMVETMEQARALADAVHYPPLGGRSYGPRRPLLRYGKDYVKTASETIVTLAMIETRRGLENLEGILSIDGFDGVFIGPADLALALGKAPVADSTDEAVVAAVSHIRGVAHAKGKRAGIFCAGAEFARARMADGFDLVTIASDLALLSNAARQSIAAVRR